MICARSSLGLSLQTPLPQTQSLGKLQTRSYSPSPRPPPPSLPCRPLHISSSEILRPAPPGGRSAGPQAWWEPCFCALGTSAFASLPANLCHACFRLAEAQARSPFQPFPVAIHVSWTDIKFHLGLGKSSQLYFGCHRPAALAAFWRPPPCTCTHALLATRFCQAFSLLGLPVPPWNPRRAWILMHPRPCCVLQPFPSPSHRNSALTLWPQLMHVLHSGAGWGPGIGYSCELTTMWRTHFKIAL